LSSKRDWYWDQYDSLDALMEALQIDNRWLEYRLQIVRGELLNQGAQAVEDASAVDKVTSALLERDEALQNVLTQNQRLTSSTQQAERSWLNTRDES
jgi:hypothetical protein